MSELHIYNTLTRKKERFEPLNPGFVGIYVCGPTVYDHSHLGHAKSYISFDIIVRYLRYLGYKVRYVQNITDVGHLLGDSDEGEDRILKQARLEKLEPMEVVETYTRSYFEDMDKLGVQRPDISPRASGHVIEQIELIQKLLKKGFAYEVNGNVYFDIRQFKAYGKLSGRNIAELEAGARVEINEEKKHPSDFALWKKATPEHLMRWPSPWGEGYPGWHIECSCMSMKYLGQPFDIHGGGLDNIFPHHECEIAQSEAGTGKPFAKYWLHNNMVRVEGVKMSKSLNNFITLKVAFKNYSPQAIRYFILTSHYRSVLDFSEAAFDAAEKGLKKLQAYHQRLLEAAARQQPGEATVAEIDPAGYEADFRAAMNDDFNTPKAIATLHTYLSAVNKIVEEGKSGIKMLEQVNRILLATAGDVLGILQPTYREGISRDKKFDQIMDVILRFRQYLRNEKQYRLADVLRDDLSSQGIAIKDTPDGTIWEINA
jgi:cysteinyl-tRNA synthetase